ncbi:hypothetical protein DV736_g1139, partial [Chaetothyriales sp. CBS 134916]
MSHLLTPRQAEELHKSMVSYLVAVGFSDSAAALRREAHLGSAFDDTTAKKYETLLEKKWTSIVRLQKRIGDLEARNAALQADLDAATPLTAARRVPRLWDASTGEAKISFLGHDNKLEAVAFAPAAAYVHLAGLAGYKKAPTASSAGEFIASAGRDKVIKIWDNRGTCHKTLVGHDNWVRGLLFHPAGRYLLSVSDDKTIRCWDLAQDGKCVRVVDAAHDHFVSSIRWAPDVHTNSQPPPATDAASAPVNGSEAAANPIQANGSAAHKKADLARIRCVIATGCVDCNVRVFAG